MWDELFIFLYILLWLEGPTFIFLYIVLWLEGPSSLVARLSPIMTFKNCVQTYRVGGSTFNAFVLKHSILTLRIITKMLFFTLSCLIQPLLAVKTDFKFFSLLGTNRQTDVQIDGFFF